MQQPLRRVLAAALAMLMATAACSASPYDSEARRRLEPLVEMDRAAAAGGEVLSLTEIRDAALAAGLSVAVGASRGVEDLSVETISANGAQRVFAMLDGQDCLFGVVGTTQSPPTVEWILVEDVYRSTDVVPSATCSASAYFGINLSGRSVSGDPASPTRLG